MQSNEFQGLTTQLQKLAKLPHQKQQSKICTAKKHAEAVYLACQANNKHSITRNVHFA